MALTRITRHQSASSTGFGTGAYTTSSFTPGTGLLVCRIAAMEATGGTVPTTTISGGGLSWTQQVISSATPPGWTYRDTVWTATGAGTSMTIQADAGAASIEQYVVEVYEYTGYDTSTPVGGTATGTDSDGDGALSLTLSAAPATADETLEFLLNALNSGTATATPTTGFTELFTATDAAWSVFESAVRGSSTSTTVGWSDINVGALGAGATGIALVIQAAAGGGGSSFPPVPEAQLLRSQLATMLAR